MIEAIVNTWAALGVLFLGAHIGLALWRAFEHDASVAIIGAPL